MSAAPGTTSVASRYHPHDLLGLLDLVGVNRYERE
jgi:hypothetical protein